MQKFWGWATRKKAPQKEPIPGREAEMEPNAEEGFVFTLYAHGILDRFLILGTEGGTYYASEREMNKKLVPVVSRLIREDGPYVVQRAVEISEAGRAARNDPALFVHALASVEGDVDTRRAAYETLHRIARTGTHLLHWVQYRDMLGGWGRGARNAVGDWYRRRGADRLAYQLLKYKQRDGWTHRDALRLAHPKLERFTGAQREVIAQAVFGEEARRPHPQVGAVRRVRAVGELREKLRLIREHKLTREMIPTELLRKPEVWEALLLDLPYIAMVRNLRHMERIGLLRPKRDMVQRIAEQIVDTERIRNSRVHPLQLLSALMVYGRSKRGFMSFRGYFGERAGFWPDDEPIMTALEEAFYGSFGNVEPTSLRTLIGLDVSSSMRGTWGAGTLEKIGLTAAIASTALCMVTARTEPEYHIFGFSDEFRPLAITANDTLASAMKAAYLSTYGGTDCALPMVYAMRNRIPVDVFVIYTDDETHSGEDTGHPSQALERYREVMGIDSKLIVVAMTSTGYTIADPQDPGMLDVVGFDTNTPRAIAEFARG